MTTPEKAQELRHQVYRFNKYRTRWQRTFDRLSKVEGIKEAIPAARKNANAEAKFFLSAGKLIRTAQKYAEENEAKPLQRAVKKTKAALKKFEKVAAESQAKKVQSFDDISRFALLKDYAVRTTERLASLVEKYTR